ncbi:MAG TPA: hypothetical protein V6C97_25335 [Oculatellaceae cyanobacterium]
MGLIKTELDNQTKIYSALAYSELEATEPLLQGARVAAYSRAAHRVTINNGKAVLESTLDGKKELPTVVEFRDASLGLPKTLDYTMVVNGSRKLHVALSADLFGSGTHMHVEMDGLTLDGRCKTNQGLTTCEEKILDSKKRLLLKGTVRTDVLKNQSDFSRTTEYFSQSLRPAACLNQHVRFDVKTSTLNADSTLSQRKIT